jgi:hypothetical protein
MIGGNKRKQKKMERGKKEADPASRKSNEFLRFLDLQTSITLKNC